MASFLAASPLPMERNLLLTTSTRTPDAISSLRMCHSFQEVKQLHAQFVVSGLLGYNPLCARRLLEAYATLSQIYYAVSIFERMPSPDVFVYNTMIRGLTMGKFLLDSLLLYKEFPFGYLVPDNYTYTFVLKACSHLKAPFEGSIHDAERVLGEFSEENTLAKTGYTKNGMHTEALALFLDMMVSQILPNEAALVSLLSSCGQLGTLHQGRWVHGYIDKTRVLMSTKLTTALIDMYAKCGSIKCGYGLFQKMAWS
ncbi:REPEAT-CONTAINING PROTEIN putative-RELATED, partial [Salix purpurea]